MHWAGGSRVPTQTGKSGKMGRHFPVREKSGNFEQTGKVRENHTRYWKNIREFQKNVMLFLVILKMNCVLFAKMDQVFSLKNKTLKNTGKNGKRYWKSQGFLSVWKSGNPEGVYPSMHWAGGKCLLREGICPGGVCPGGWGCLLRGEVCPVHAGIHSL